MDYFVWMFATVWLSLLHQFSGSERDWSILFDAFNLTMFVVLLWNTDPLT